MFNTNVPVLSSTDVHSVGENTCNLEVEYLGSPYEITLNISGVASVSYSVREDAGKILFSVSNLDKSFCYPCDIVASTVIGESIEVISLAYSHGAWRQA